MRYQQITLRAVWLAAFCALANASVATAAPSSTDTTTQTDRTTQHSRTTTTTTEKQQYVQGTQQHLNRLHRDVDQLQQDAGTAADKSLRIAAANLAVGLKVAQEKFDALKQSSGPAWRRLRAGLDRSLVFLDRGVRDLDAKLRARQHS